MGTYLREIGHNLYAWSFAHAVKVDKEACGKGGQGRQHLGDGQGIGHGDQVRSGGAGGHGVRSQARGLRTMGRGR